MDLCATIRHMVKGEMKEEEVDEVTVGDHDSIVSKNEDNEEDEHMEINEDENEDVIEQQKRI